MFTLKQLNEIMPKGAKLKLTDKFYNYLLKYMEEYEITSIPRISCFLATIAVESGELQYTKEIWGPTEAQLRYEGRKDLGNVIAGDGFKFRGRGLIQITGRDNYHYVGTALNLSLVDHPELLEQPEYAALASCWWWKKNGCNELSDGNDNILSVSRKVNLGNSNSSRMPNGWAERKKYYDNAFNIISRPDFSNVTSGII